MSVDMIKPDDKSVKSASSKAIKESNLSHKFIWYIYITIDSLTSTKWQTL